MENGQYVIVRAAEAGVFAGHLVSRVGSEVTLRDARRIWSWAGAATLSELAVVGTRLPEQCRFPTPVPEVLILGVVEVLSVTPEAEKSIKEVPVWTAAA